MGLHVRVRRVAAHVVGVSLIGAAAVTMTSLPATAAPAPARAAARCAEPGARWATATPAQANMDGAVLQTAIDRAATDLGLAVRVYRHGCLVGRDRLAAANDAVRFESWSMAKSVTSLVFGRAWSLGLISPDDPLGSLVPEADRAHGSITMRQLLTQTSGLDLNPARDYNIAIPDRVRAALKTNVMHTPGTKFGYSQNGPALVAEAVQRAVGEDFQTFAQRELFGPLGIEAGTWHWQRDLVGHTQGFFGLRMTPDDFARLGELLRRDGVWNGRRLLSADYVASTRTPNSTNGCHSQLIWVNAAAPCNQPTGRSEDRLYPGLPADLYSFNGLFDQYVAVLPTQGLVIVRLGGPGVAGLAGGSDVLAGGNGIAALYAGVLDAVNEPVTPPPPPPRVASAASPDTGFDAAAILRALTQPLVTLDPVLVWFLQPLPPKGPARARAAVVAPTNPQATAAGVVSSTVRCPARWPGGARNCTGTLSLTDGAGALAAARPYDVRPGATATVAFTLTAARRTALCRAGTLRATATAINIVGPERTVTAQPVTVRKPTTC